MTSVPLLAFRNIKTSFSQYMLYKSMNLLGLYLASRIQVSHLISQLVLNQQVLLAWWVCLFVCVGFLVCLFVCLEFFASVWFVLSVINLRSIVELIQGFLTGYPIWSVLSPKTKVLAGAVPTSEVKKVKNGGQIIES